MGMSQDQAMAAFHAAKMAQLNAMGQGFDKLPPGLLPPSLDIAKVNNNQSNTESFLSKLQQSNSSVTIEPATTNNNSSKLPPASNAMDIRRSSGSGGGDGRHDREPMDLGPDCYTSRMDHKDHGNDGGNSSADERNYTSDDDGASTTAVVAN